MFWAIDRLAGIHSAFVDRSSRSSAPAGRAPLLRLGDLALSETGTPNLGGSSPYGNAFRGGLGPKPGALRRADSGHLPPSCRLRHRLRSAGSALSRADVAGFPKPFIGKAPNAAQAKT